MSKNLPPSFLKLLSTRVFLLALAALIVLMAASSFFAYSYLEKQHHLHLNTHLNSITHELVTLQNQALAEARSLSYRKQVFDLLPVKDTDAINKIDAMLRRHIHASDVDQILITDESGNLITVYPKYTSLPEITKDRFDKSAALRRSRSGLAGRSIETDEQGLAIVASMPVFLPDSDYRVTGSVTTEFHIDKQYLLDIKNRLHLDVAIIVNEDDLTSTLTQAHGISARGILRQAKAGTDTRNSLTTNIFGVATITDTKYITAISALIGEDNTTPVASIILLEKESILWNQIAIFLAGLFISFISIFTIVGGLSYWIARKITNPLIAVSDALIELSHGNFPMITSLNTSQETYKLTQAAKTLSDTLKQDKEELTRAHDELVTYRDHLEELVNSRTLELKQTTEELIQARDAAEKANITKSKFLSRMSHELRTPLNAILGFGQLLKLDEEHPLTNEQKDQANDIINAGQHLLILITDLLDISKIEAGKLDMELVSLEIRNILHDCLTIITPLADNRSIQIKDIINYNQVGMVIADETRLKQVLINLMSNAIKYNRDYGEIILSSKETEDNRLVIYVMDNGYGIDETMMHKLFQPFERFTHTEQYVEGTGLGLTLSKTLIEQMNGEIGVTSVINEGSTFWIALKLAETRKGIKEQLK